MQRLADILSVSSTKRLASNERVRSPTMSVTSLMPYIPFENDELSDGSSLPPNSILQLKSVTYLPSREESKRILRHRPAADRPTPPGHQQRNPHAPKPTSTLTAALRPAPPGSSVAYRPRRPVNPSVHWRAQAVLRARSPSMAHPGGLRITQHLYKLNHL